MNWVGGARSRLKVPNEKRVQRDYFERKRLSTKMNRANTHNHKLPISKDLLFLSKAAKNTTTEARSMSPIRPAPRRVNLDSAAKQCPRDIELPMSPIEKPSTLELMDISTVLSNSSLLLDQSVPFHHSSVVNGEFPKVSTQKVPHGTVLNRFGAGVNGRSTSNHQHSEQETDANNLLNVSCMTESLFPVRKRKQMSASNEKSEVVRTEQNTTRNMHNHKKYSIDDILNSSQFKESFIPQPPKNIPKSRSGPKVAPNHADALLWMKPSGNFKDIKRKRPAPLYDDLDSVNTKRKTTKAEKPYHLGEWKTHQVKTRVSRQPLKGKIEVVHDKDVMLEFHYGQQEKIKKNTHHGHIEQTKDCLRFEMDPPVTEKTSREGTSGVLFPWSRSPSQKRDKESTSSSILTEDPLSRRNMFRTIKAVLNQKPSSMEDILGPVQHIPQRVPEDIDHATYDTTIFNESILGPVKDKRSGQKGGMKLTESKSNKKDNRSSTFEQMMTSFERETNSSCDVQNDLAGPCKKFTVIEENLGESDMTISGPTEVRKNSTQHNQWKDFVSEQHPKNLDTKKDDLYIKTGNANTCTCEGKRPLKFPSLPQIATLKGRGKRRMDCSAFEELMCLEQEPLMGLDNYSQDITLSPLEWNEEPIMRRVPEMEYEVERQSCPFDSSQGTSLNSNSYHHSCDISSPNSISDTLASDLECSLSEQEVPLLQRNSTQTKHKEVTSSSSPSLLKAESQVDNLANLNNPKTTTESSKEIHGIPSLESKARSHSNMIVRSETETETDFLSEVQHVLIKRDEVVQADLQSSPKDSSVYVDTITVTVSTQTSPCSIPEHDHSTVDKILPSSSTDVHVNGGRTNNTSTLVQSLCSQPLNNETQVDTRDMKSCVKLGDHLLVDVIELNQTSSSQTKSDADNRELCIDDSEYNNTNSTRCLSSDSEASRNSNDITASSHGESCDSKKSLNNDYVQTDLSMGQVDMLRREVERLQEALKIAESTIIWQSLMMRIQNMP